MKSDWRAALAPGGARLLSFLDGLPVESNWLAGHHIVWQTGQQNGPAGVGIEDHTHCSALVAAISLYLDIYILRPPHHSQELLANAQVGWLTGRMVGAAPSAAASGWRVLGTSGDRGTLGLAADQANNGKLVVAGYLQPPTSDPVTGKPAVKSGHIVVVRPQDRDVDPDKGPLVISAGDRNWSAIHMAEAFASHQGAWPGSISLFVHDTDLEAEIGIMPVTQATLSTP